MAGLRRSGRFLRALQQAKCSFNVLVARGELLRFQQFGSAIAQGTRVAIDETEVFVKLGTGAAIAADRDCLFQLGDGLRPIVRIGRGQCEIAQRLCTIHNVLVRL